MINFYLVPKIGSGTFTDSYRPKYINSIDMPGVKWAGMNLGIEPTFLIGSDLTQQQHDFVSAQSDVITFPPLDNTVGGNPTLNRTRNGLEQHNIPGNHIVSSTTWRQVIGNIGRNCLILQRLNGLHRTRLFPPGISLDSLPDETTLSQLVGVGQSFTLNTSSLSISSTMRANLLSLTSQMGPFMLMGVAF